MFQRRKRDKREKAKEGKIVREKQRVIGFLRLLDGTRLDLVYDKGSKVVLLGYKDCVLRLTLREYEDLVEALGNFLKEIKP